MKSALAVSLAFAASLSCAADVQPVKDAGPYVPSPQSVVADMLRYADVGPSDFLIDLGSGDGRIVLTAAKVFGARGFGVEIKDELVTRSNAAAKNEGLADRVKFLKQDLFKTDIAQATVITMYLLPDTVNLLKDKFLTELRPGTRIVSHDYPLTGWKPVKYEQFDLEEKVNISGVTTTLIYVYMVPAKVAGTWKASFPASLGAGPASMVLTQNITRVSGSVFINKKELPIEYVDIVGEQIKFKLKGRKGEFSGKVKGKTIEGVLDTGGGSKTPWSATLGG
ncbi:MAG TPA: methyltransferase domain-containing protein [Burkholderiales bacterium]|nr:methyltransferase domain-containing protein [Burkholderiales bacterium]